MVFIVKVIDGVKKIIPVTADAGAGNPVGTIIPMYKKSNPQGYLYCDGSTFDQNAYPLLYAYLGSNVLPDYRECAIVGAEQNGTDTIANHDVFTQGEFKDDQLQFHAHRTYVNGDSQFPFNVTAGLSGAGGTWGSGNQYPVIALGNYGNASRMGNTTRGKRKAVYFYIKATSGLSENAQDNVINTLNEQRSYSTEEHLTGRKWIDGKPTYEKTIAEDVTQSDAWDLSTLNIADIIEIKGLAYGTNDQYIGWFPINGSMLTSQPSSNTNFVRLLLTHNHNLLLQVYGAGSGATQLNVTKVRITLEYTKTTD